MFNKPLILSGGSATTPVHKIDQSIRFNHGDSAYMHRTPSSSGNTKTFTYSVWFKLGDMASTQRMFLSVRNSDTNRDNLMFNQGSSGDFRIFFDARVSGSAHTSLEIERALRDPSAWYHLVMSIDTTKDVETERVRFYLNGERQTSFEGTANFPNKDQTYYINSTNKHSIGRFEFSSPSGYWDGYMAEIVLLDGTATDCNSFAQLNSSGIWIPKDVSGLTFGTNGFHIKGQFAGATNSITALGDIQHSTAQNKIGSSSILFDGNGDLLEVGGSSNWYDFGANGNPWTMEAYVRFDTVSITQKIFWQNNTFIGISYVTGSGIKVQLNNGGINFTASWSPSINTWYHVAVVRQTNNTTTVYIDGTSIGSGTISGGSTASYKVEIGAYSPSTDEFDGYMDEIRISSVARFTSSFTPTTSEYTADGDTLALIHSNTTNGSTVFKNDVGFGNDSSGNQNNFQTEGLAVHDQVLDRPTNNFCVMNPLSNSGSGTLTQGNLRYAGASTGNNVAGTIGMSSDKWYWELYIEDDNQVFPGVQDSGILASGYTEKAVGVETGDNGDIHEDDANSGLDSIDANTGDIVGVAFDATNKKIWWSLNGVWYRADQSSTAVINVSEVEAGNQGYDLSSRTPDFFMPFIGNYTHGTAIINFGQEGTFAGNTTAGGNSDGNGVGNFKYSVPSGYLALCTKNLGS